MSADFQIAPLLVYYGKNVYKVDATQSIPAVREQFNKLIGGLLTRKRLGDDFYPLLIAKLQ